MLLSSSLQCFIYHIDKGLRAGGGIGDVLQSAAGDPDEILRLLFDVTFFFFVIVILLAIIQGGGLVGNPCHYVSLSKACISVHTSVTHALVYGH